ncbi:MAG: chromate transporter [Bacillota bacterium]|nr:chromate transporter [Bacillota bacterium]
MILIELYLQFLIIGATAFGGGYAVLPLINSYIVEGKGWITMAEMTDVITISNMTPGPIAINSATFVGTKVAGLPGSIVATLGVVTPSFILMSIIGYVLFAKNKRLTFLEKMLKTLRPTVVGLIAIAAVDLIQEAIFTNNASPESFTINYVPLLTFFVGLYFYYKKVNLTKLILVGAALGIGLSFVF